MVPANQGFDPDDCLGRRIHLGLVMQGELAALQRAAQRIFDAHAFERFFLQGGREKLEVSRIALFDAVQGHVGVLEQLLGRLPVTGVDRDARAARQRHLLALHRHGTRQGRHDAPHGVERLNFMSPHWQDQDELVATGARCCVDVARAVHQPARHLLEQHVAHVMAQAVVEKLEPVQIDVHDPDRLRVAPGVGNGVVQALTHQVAVGQPGQRVVLGLVEQLSLQPLALGDVGHDHLDRRLAVIDEGNARHADVEQGGVEQARLVFPRMHLLIDKGGACAGIDQARGDRAAQQLHGLRGAEQALRRGIGEDHTAVDLDQDGIGRQLDEQPVALFAFAQGCCSHFTVLRLGMQQLKALLLQQRLGLGAGMVGAGQAPLEHAVTGRAHGWIASA